MGNKVTLVIVNGNNHDIATQANTEWSTPTNAIITEL